MTTETEKSISFQDYTISEFSRLFEKKEASPLEITEYCIQNIESYNPELNAFCHTDFAQARHNAAKSTERWRNNTPLSIIDGIPTTIKDLFQVKGWPMRQGSLLLEGYISEEDSPAVAHLRNNGAILLGTTTTPEFGHKGVTDSPATGITRNPWNTNKTPGGSSGGSAVAAAMDMGFIHLGSDGGGSCRIPASFTGIFGFKPSQNTIPIAPVSPFYDFATPGLLSKCVDDVKTVLPLLQAPHPFDKGHIQPPEQTHECKKDNYKIGYISNFPDTPLCPETEIVLKRAVHQLSSHVTIEDISPEFDTLLDVFGTYWTSGAYTMLQGFNKMDKEEKMDPNLAAFEAYGSTLSQDDLSWAAAQRDAITQTCHALLQNYDFLMLPTMPLTAFEGGLALPPHPETQEDWVYWSPFTYLANMAGLPASSSPVGLTASGLPVGLQVIGNRFADMMVLDFCQLIENVFPVMMPPIKKTQASSL